MILAMMPDAKTNIAPPPHARARAPSTTDILVHQRRSFVQISEQALDSTSSQTGTITIGLPGLPDGVNVTRNHDNFYVNDGNTLLERDEVRVSLPPPLSSHYRSSFW